VPHNCLDMGEEKVQPPTQATLEASPPLSETGEDPGTPNNHDESNAVGSPEEANDVMTAPTDDNKSNDNDMDDLFPDAKDSISTSSDDDSDAAFSPTEDPMDIIVNATTAKENGNDHFKTGDLESAKTSYRKGANLLKPLNKNNTGDEQVKALLVTLQNNLSMVFFKQGKIKLSRDVASKSLQIDSTNVKALYRRAVAHRKMSDLEKARDDLKEALKHDANNNAVKRELLAVKKELVDFTQKQKKALSAAFSSGGSSLYEDKEQEQQQKLDAKRKKKEEEAKAKEKRKVDWEDDCVKRMAKNEPAISFEDWEKERAEEEKKKKEEEEKHKKAERKARQAAKKAAQANKKPDSDSDDDELTPSELAMMRGYKKTADGRVTSYFTREQSEKEKGLIGDIRPQKLDSAPQLLSSSSGEGTDGTKQKGRPSVWNQAGTWEEKNTTTWCTDRLKERLLETKINVQAKSLERYSAVVSKVDDLTGDASVATTNGKKRYIFDFHLKLKFEVRDADVDEKLAEGSLHIPDLCSTHHEELEVNFTGWKEKPGSGHQENATECQLALISEIRAKVKQWVDDFNHHY